MGDDAVASLISGSPVRDARRKSFFSFLRSRSTCQDASEKPGLSLALGLQRSRLSREACVRVSVRGQQSWDANLLGCGENTLGQLQVQGRAPGTEDVRPASQDFGAMVSKHCPYYSELFGALWAIDPCHNYSTPLLKPASSHRLYINEWAWVCSHKTLSSKIGGRPNLALGL